MAIIIELYDCTSPPNYVNKVITLVDSLSGTLRKPTSVINPDIIIERERPTGFNYVHIPSFGRYYFVRGISSEGNNLVGISLHVDVLMTYAPEIREARAIIKRQENDFNLYLNDDKFAIYQNMKNKTLVFPNSFTGESYILALAGNSPE